jgi:hypothetical protein
MNKKSISYLLLCLFLLSCNKDEVKGIEIWDTLNSNLSYFENRKLESLIERAFKKDSDAFSELSKFDCGGGAGCYDLGFVITQIVYRIGENEFLRITKNISTEEKLQLKSLIRAGLDQGDNNGDGKIDYKKLENEFPKLSNEFAE